MKSRDIKSTNLTSSETDDSKFNNQDYYDSMTIASLYSTSIYSERLLNDFYNRNNNEQPESKTDFEIFRHVITHSKHIFYYANKKTNSLDEYIFQLCTPIVANKNDSFFGVLKQKEVDKHIKTFPLITNLINKKVFIVWTMPEKKETRKLSDFLKNFSKDNVYAHNDNDFFLNQEVPIKPYINRINFHSSLSKLKEVFIIVYKHLYDLGYNDSLFKDLSITFNTKSLKIKISDGYDNVGSGEKKASDPELSNSFKLNEYYCHSSNSSVSISQAIKNYDELDLKDRGDAVIYAFYIFTFIDPSMRFYSRDSDNLWQQQGMFKILLNIDLISDEFSNELNRVDKTFLWNANCVTFHNLILTIISDIKQKNIPTETIAYQLDSLISEKNKIIIQKELTSFGVVSPIFDILILVARINEIKTETKELFEKTKIADDFIYFSGNNINFASNKDKFSKNEAYNNNIDFLEGLFIFEWNKNEIIDLRNSTIKTWRANFRKLLKVNSFLSSRGENLVYERYWDLEKSGEIISNQIINSYILFFKTFHESPDQIIINKKGFIDSFIEITKSYEKYMWTKKLNDSEKEIFLFYLFVMNRFGDYNINESAPGLGYSLNLDLFSDEKYIKYIKNIKKYEQVIWDTYIKPLILRMKIIRKSNKWLQFVMYNNLMNLFRRKFQQGYLYAPAYYDKKNHEKTLRTIKEIILRDYIASKIIIWDKSMPKKSDKENPFKNYKMSSGHNLFNLDFFEKRIQPLPNSPKFWKDLKILLFSKKFKMQLFNQAERITIRNEEFNRRLSGFASTKTQTERINKSIEELFLSVEKHKDSILKLWK